MQNTFDALSVKMGQGEEKGRPHVWTSSNLVCGPTQGAGLEVTGETRSLGLLLTPLFARWSLVIFLYGSASFAEGTARILADNVRAWHLALTTVLTLALAAFLVGRIALWIGLYLSLLALLSRTYLRRRNGCIGSDNFGAVVELSETELCSLRLIVRQHCIHRRLHGALSGLYRLLFPS
jgi:cobalamin synthase